MRELEDAVTRTINRLDRYDPEVEGLADGYENIQGESEINGTE